MEIQSIKLVCFSPTRTTKAVIQCVARGIDHRNVELIDITKPNSRAQQLQTSGNELIIVAVPVYLGRVPALLVEWLRSIRSHNTPAACIVVYGNRTYGDALLELKDILIKCGCIPIAGAAFIGEHSFSSSEIPTAEGRPDINDLNHAELFGRRINEKLCSVSSAEQFSHINIPGNYPYGGITELWSIDFIALNNNCNQCGLCAQECPVGAVDLENSSLIDKEKCITCCACIKNCPQNARTIKTGPVKDAAIRLNILCKERKEPVFFF